MAKRVLALILLVVTALTLLASCSNGKTGNEDTPGSSAAVSSKPQETGAATAAPQETPAEAANADTKTVRIGIAGNPATLDPWSTVGEGRVDVLRNVYEFLFDITYIGGPIAPVIASGYEQIDDLTYNITIYDYVHDSKGNPITSEDVVFSYVTAIELGFSGANLGSVESVTALDEYTVQLKLKSTGAGLFENAVGYTAIVSKAEYEKNPDAFISSPIGTGAYVVVEHVPGSSLTFKKNENYWQTDESLRAEFSKANIGTIVYSIIPEASQLSLALETGAIDVGYFISTADVHRFENDKYALYTPPKDLADLILFNGTEGNIFTNQKLRQAVCYAIDNSLLLQNVYEGNGRVCKTYGSSVFSDYLEKWEDEDYLEYDPAKAKQLLAEAGYPDGVTVRLLTANRTHHVLMAQMIQSMLKEVGIKATLVTVDSSVFTSIVRVDPTQEPWDFYLDNRSSFDYVVNVWSFSFDANRNKGHTVNFFVDDKLQELLATSIDMKTHTPENTDAMHNYLKEICIGYGLCYGTYNFASVSTITELSLDFKSRLVPGACTYTADFIGG